MLRKISSLIKYLDVDSAILFTVINNFFRVISGLASLYVITKFFTPETQGYYYTFSSILALQSFVELGLTVVIINIASHEWAHLSLNKYGDISGNKNNISRLKSLAKFTLHWFGMAGFIFAAVSAVLGYIFFDQNNNLSGEWIAPWFMVSLIAGFSIPFLPFVSFLEGCNQVKAISKFRLLQSSAMTITFLMFAILGKGLWAMVASMAVSLMCVCWLLFVKYRRFFTSLISSNLSCPINWRTEIWPLQWKIGLSGVVSYFAMSLFVPVMFKYYGAVVAGQMGVTIALAGSIQGIGLAWINTKIAIFGGHVARRDYISLDKLWIKSSFISITIVFISFLILIITISVLNGYDNKFINRLLPLSSSIYYFIATILMQVTQCESIYLRAHKREPLFLLGFISSIIIGVLVWKMGELYGPIGATLSYFMVVLLCIFPWITYIWYRAKIDWREIV